jgi:hypothetical protein
VANETSCAAAPISTILSVLRLDWPIQVLPERMVSCVVSSIKTNEEVVGDYALVTVMVYVLEAELSSRVCAKQSSFDSCRRRSHAIHVNGAKEHFWYNPTVPLVIFLQDLVVPKRMKTSWGSTVGGSDSATYVLQKICPSGGSSVVIHQSLSSPGSRLICVTFATNRGGIGTEGRSELIRNLNGQLRIPRPRRCLFY